MGLFTKDLAGLSDDDISTAINMLVEEQRNRQRAANRQLIENFKKAADALDNANITYHIEYQDDNIYLGSAEDYHFDYY